jgi:Fibronectin type III domain
MADLPVAPSDVRIVEISNTSIRVAWEHPEPNVTFEVTYKTKDSSLHIVSNIRRNHLEIGELTANAEYRIVVRAANEFGIGMYSLPLVYVNNSTVNFSFLACFKNCLSLDSFCTSSGVLLMNFCVSILGAMVWCIGVKTDHKKILLATVKYNKDNNEENTEADCNIYYEIGEF